MHSPGPAALFLAGGFFYSFALDHQHAGKAILMPRSVFFYRLSRIIYRQVFFSSKSALCKVSIHVYICIHCVRIAFRFPGVFQSLAEAEPKETCLRFWSSDKMEIRYRRSSKEKHLAKWPRVNSRVDTVNGKSTFPGESKRICVSRTFREAF